MSHPGKTLDVKPFYHSKGSDLEHVVLRALSLPLLTTATATYPSALSLLTYRVTIQQRLHGLSKLEPEGDGRGAWACLIPAQRGSEHQGNAAGRNEFIALEKHQ